MLEPAYTIALGVGLGWLLSVGTTLVNGWRDRQARMRINAEITQEGSYIRCENPADLEEVRR